MVVFLRIVFIRHHSERSNMMNILHKSLTMAFLAVFIFSLGINVDFLSAQNTVAGPAVSRHPRDLTTSRYVKFRRITTEEGLSGNLAFAVARDKHSFMWVATDAGLSRYDGTNIKVYRHDPDDTGSLSHSVVRAMIADRSGGLWIGTWGGPQSL
jgi:ligand-binding sensor domain-containing protein